MRRVYLYTRYERFWHWTQALLLIGLGLTGSEIHGVYRWLGFEKAYKLHTLLGWGLVVLVAFTIFWHFTTGQWKQYLPTTERVGTLIRFYTVGMFRGEPHPYKKTELSKLNPLQRLTYLGFKLLIVPVLGTTGLLMIFYNRLAAWGLSISLGTLATLHTAAAFLLLAFFILHVYMTTTGHTVFSNLKSMILGYEEIPWEEQVEQI